jgi:peptidoglycan/LPS O-acetylase OafA/YrhL
MSAAGVSAGSKPLADYVGGRDNNFNLIRFVAASAVLYSHSYALSTGDKMTEPLRWLDVTPGMLAVDVFFLTSGFLVTSSLLARRSISAFTLARVLRIYPALLAAVVLTVLAVGLHFTTLPARAFFAEHQTWAYVARNVTLVTGIEHVLPGSFDANPWRSAVNASLWTLPYEIAMYFVLGLIWVVLAAWPAGDPARSFGRVVVALSLLALAANLVVPIATRSSAVRLGAMFFAGSALFLFRARIRMDLRVFVLLVLAVAASMWNSTAFRIVYTLAIPYLVFYFAFVVGGPIRLYNRLGDYSYGIYIYAWPVQQMVAASIPGITPPTMLLVSFACTLALAMISWHVIEKRALAFGKRRRRPVVAMST